MKRRNFVYGLGLAGLSIPLQSFSATAERQISTNKKLLPKRLSKGDTIGITSPAGAIFDNEPYEMARENLEAMELNVKFGEFAKSRYGHLAEKMRESSVFRYLKVMMLSSRNFIAE